VTTNNKSVFNGTFVHVENNTWYNSKITRCWDCSIASKYFMIWLLKSLAFSFCKDKVWSCFQLFSNQTTAVGIFFCRTSALPRCMEKGVIVKRSKLARAVALRPSLSDHTVSTCGLNHNHYKMYSKVQLHRMNRREFLKYSHVV